MNARQRKKWLKQHPEFANPIAEMFRRVGAQVIAAWNKFYSQIPPDIKKKINQKSLFSVSASAVRAGRRVARGR